MTILAQMFWMFWVVVFVYIVIKYIIRVAVRPGHFIPASSSRRLGKFEECLEILSNEREGTTNSCYVMTLHSKEKLTESVVRQALLRLAKRQPMLRAVIKTVSSCSWFKQNNEKHFEIIEPNKIVDMIDLTTSDIHASQWQKAWHDIVIRRLETGLQWQAILFTEEYLPDNNNYLNTIIFRANHCIIDGVSGMQLCKQFLDNLNSVSEDSRALDEDISSLDLQPSFYELIGNARPRSWWDYLPELLGMYYIYKLVTRLRLSFSLANKPRKPFQFLMAQPSLEVHDLVYKVFSERETSQVIKMCRSKRVTVTGALFAATHIAFCKLINTGNSIFDEILTHGFPVNGLRVCKPKPPVEYLGHFAISATLPIATWYNGDGFWSTAQAATKQIQTIIKEGKYVSKQLSKFDIFTQKEIVDEFISPLDPGKKLKLLTENTISSAGAFTFSHNNTAIYKLHECLYYALCSGFPSFADHFNTTVNGKMSWVIMCDHFVPRPIEEQFAKLCFDTLLKETQE